LFTFLVSLSTKSVLGSGVGLLFLGDLLLLLLLDLPLDPERDLLLDLEEYERDLERDEREREREREREEERPLLPLRAGAGLFTFGSLSTFASPTR